MATYLVTGAAGFIGRSIAAALLKRGERVRGIDSFITGKRANLVGLEAMDFIKGDLTDPAVCARVCEGIEVVFHEAALASVPRSVADPINTNLHCVTATLNLLVAARAAGIRRVIYAGSSSAYGDTPTLPKHEAMLPNPISPYAVAKLAGEHYMRAFSRVYGLETAALLFAVAATLVLGIVPGQVLHAAQTGAHTLQAPPPVPTEIIGIAASR